MRETVYLESLASEIVDWAQQVAFAGIGGPHGSLKAHLGQVRGGEPARPTWLSWGAGLLLPSDLNSEQQTPPPAVLGLQLTYPVWRCLKIGHFINTHTHTYWLFL